MATKAAKKLGDYVLLAIDRRRLGGPALLVASFRPRFRLTRSLRRAATFGPRQAEKAAGGHAAPARLLVAARREECREMVRGRSRIAPASPVLPLRFGTGAAWDRDCPVAALILPERLRGRIAEAGLTTLGELLDALGAGPCSPIDERDERALRPLLPDLETRPAPGKRRRLSTFEIWVETTQGPKFLCPIRAESPAAAEKLARRLDDAQGYRTSVRPATRA